MKPKEYFANPSSVTHRQFEALRAFFLEKCPATEVAQRFGYSLSSFYSLVRDFKEKLAKDEHDPFFISRQPGRPQKDSSGTLKNIIVELRKKNLSTSDITAIMQAMGHDVSEKYVYNVLSEDGFARLPRRTKQEKKQGGEGLTITAPKSIPFTESQTQFSSQNTLGAMCILPLLQQSGILELIEHSSYPQTSTMDRISSILSFVALKLSNVRRYSGDDMWCMDRGLGLFAGRNVLPKTTWYSSYSSRITRNMNSEFLQGMYKIWSDCGLLSDTANLDFTTIPYWGEDEHLENNWSGKRNKGLSSMLALLAQDQNSGILTYGDTTVRHDRQNEIVLEFLDFSSKDTRRNVRYMVFDSRFTTYQNLARLDKDIKFITIRRRGKNIVDTIEHIPSKDWKRVRIMKQDGKGRSLRVHDQVIYLKHYGKDIRQIAVTGHGKIKPALIITNDFEKPLEEIIRMYSRRWQIEKNISEQIEFFHLNRVSSSMVIKVDFDLTMSILSYNLLRLFAQHLPGYMHSTPQTLYDKFLNNGGSIIVEEDKVIVKLKKKRNLPAILEAMTPLQKVRIPFLGNRVIHFEGESYS